MIMFSNQTAKKMFSVATNQMIFVFGPVTQALPAIAVARKGKHTMEIKGQGAESTDHGTNVTIAIAVNSDASTAAVAERREIRGWNREANARDACA